MAPDDDDKTVKEQLIDAATRAELERWFGLPSFQELASDERAEPAPEDPDMVAARERRAKALEAVDPVMVERHRVRVEDAADAIIRFKPMIETRVDPSVALLDHTMIDRQASIAEPREVEISEELRDDLKECTPQAILRDLHRPELDFEKTFEITDYGAENRVDVVGLVREVMGAKYKPEPVGESPFREGREILRDLRKARYQSWAHVLPSLPNRRVTE